MAKEMMIIFVYDMEYCKSEEDDPAKAIVYFHPNWVSDQQRTNLCGQIMGTSHFLQAVFSLPKILALQSGKFYLHQFGRYMLAVGTDRNIDDWVLEHRANILKSLIEFFHSDLESIYHLSQGHTNFSEKLYSMFETYLRILQYNGNTFSNSPLLNLPKSASSVYLEAIQLLQYCQEMKTVLGGTMLYHNKVVATQLSSDLTKTLVMTDPYRIKSPAEVVTTDYSLPIGVQLMYVYIKNYEHKKLCNDSARLRKLSDPLCRMSTKKVYQQKAPKEPVLSAMKRDQSLLFTTVPEEDIDHTSPSPSKEPIPRIIDRPKSRQDRPKSLSLKFTTSDSTEKQQIVDPISTPFTGRTSICSTPMTEKFMYGNPLSIICNDIELETIPPKTEKTPKINKNIPALTESQSLNSILSQSEIESRKQIDFKAPITNLFLPCNNILDRKKSSSITIQKSTRNISMRYYGIGLTGINSSVPDEDNKHLYNTITDPLFPVFRADGVVISKPLYDFCVDKHYELYENEFGKEMFITNNQVNSITNTDDWKSLDDFDSEMKESPKKIKSIENSLSSVEERKPQEKRRGLSLPLKSLSDQNCDNTFQNFRKTNGGVQLTPLMSKLSLLAMEEKLSSGFCSRDTTPMSEYRDFGITPGERSNYSFLRKNSVKKEKSEEENEEFKRAVLFICGQQDMVLGLILEEDAINNKELIHNLWDVCTESLGKLEIQLRQCLDPYPVANTEQGETYSYLCIDPQWDTTKRGGPWGVTELGSLTHLHREFNKARNLMEITIRNEDSVIYGYRCGQNEVYYQQSANCNPGLPPPADPMGVAPLKARRKLERDHAIILL